MIAHLRVFLISLVVSGLVYPLVVTGISKLAFSKSAEGSVIEEKGKVIGSQLIAQKFEQEKYFWPRPSANNYNPMESGGSNLGPTSRKLLLEVEERQKKDKDAAPEMWYASGSGLDPDITVENARKQATRVARARNLDIVRVQGLIDINVKPNPFGNPYVNVLELNVALDKL